MNLKKIKATFFIGYHFVLLEVKKLFKLNFKGLKNFTNNYKNDRIFPISKEWRLQMTNFSHCHSCRLCDAVCPAITHDPKQTAPSFLAISYSRQLTDLVYFDETNCVDCKRCEDICPQKVPLVSLIRFMKESHQLLQ